MTPGTGTAPAILVASGGDPFPPELLARVRELAGDRRPPIVVMSVARIWGTALGLPHPGLYPTRQEMQEQKDRVEAAKTALGEEGVQAQTAVITARNAGKAIARYAEKVGCGIILVAGRRGPRWQRLVFGDLPHEIGRRTRIPVEPVRPSDL
jgi:nucleotide-binding universal stress UspA family protein